MTGNIILASKSPRRAALLKRIFPSFQIRPSGFDESQISEPDPVRYTQRLAEQKATAVAAGPDDIVIGCDTVVVYNGEIFGKPACKSDEMRILRLLSGNTHSVVSGVCIRTDKKLESFAAETLVTFYPLSEEEMERYADSPEPYDKAGGYGIQGNGGLFVQKIDGDYNNAVGLPLAELARRLAPILRNRE